MRTRKTRLIGAGVTIVVLGVVGLVYAAWTTNGSGSGYAKAGSAVDLSTVDVSAETTGDLYPNSNPVTITDVTAGSGDVTAADGIGTCETTGVSFLDQHGLSINVGAESDSGVIQLENAAHMSNESENGCQNAVFTIPVVLSGASSNPGNS